MAGHTTIKLIPKVFISRPDNVIDNFERYGSSSCVALEMIRQIGRLKTYPFSGNQFQFCRVLSYLHCLMKRTAMIRFNAGGFVYAHEFSTKSGNGCDLIKVGLAKNVKSRLVGIKNEVKRFGEDYKHNGSLLILPTKSYNQASYIEQSVHSSLLANGCGYSGEYYTDDFGCWKILMAWYVSAVIATE